MLKARTVEVGAGGLAAFAVYSYFNPTSAIGEAARIVSCALMGLSVTTIVEGINVNVAQLFNNAHRTRLLVGNCNELDIQNAIALLEGHQCLNELIEQATQKKTTLDAYIGTLVEKNSSIGVSLQLLSLAAQLPNSSCEDLVKGLDKAQAIFKQVAFVSALGQIKPQEKEAASADLEAALGNVVKSDKFSSNDLPDDYMKVLDDLAIENPEEVLGFAAIKCGEEQPMFFFQISDTNGYRFYDPSPDGGFYTYTDREAFFYGLRATIRYRYPDASLRFFVRKNAQV